MPARWYKRVDGRGNVLETGFCWVDIDSYRRKLICDSPFR